MRLDDASPRTWLLAAVAGWALLAWWLAIAGMGARVAPLADDPALLAPLPPMRPAPALRPGPASQYDAIATRPLFSPDRTPQAFFLEGGDDAVQGDGFDYVLTSVLITPQVKLAILQSADGSESLRVRLEQSLDAQPAWRLVGLDERSAVFDGPQGRRTLELRVFDGASGAPTSAAVEAASGDPGARRHPAATAPAAGAARAEAGYRPSPTPAPGAAAATDSSANPEPPAPSAAADPASAGPATEPVTEPATEPAIEQAQMDAIRQRIQARRAALEQPSPPPQPPGNSR